MGVICSRIWVIVLPVVLAKGGNYPLFAGASFWLFDFDPQGRTLGL
jgi:hypothetical protein